MTCITDSEMGLLDLVTQFRAQHGLPPLRPSAILMESAHQWAEFMASNDYFAHDGSYGSTHTSRAHDLGYPASAWVGANILFGQPDADKAFAAWKNSPPHRDNMLGRSYTEIGVALGVEPGWDMQGDVYLAASMELGTGTTTAAERCTGTSNGLRSPTPIRKPEHTSPVTRPRPPRAHLPKQKPPAKVDGLAQLIIDRVYRRLGLR